MSNDGFFDADDVKNCETCGTPFQRGMRKYTKLIESEAEKRLNRVK
jgi:uncharacterized membrane protein YvbJ